MCVQGKMNEVLVRELKHKNLISTFDTNPFEDQVSAQLAPKLVPFARDFCQPRDALHGRKSYFHQRAMILKHHLQ